jgi:hypothetical protein
MISQQTITSAPHAIGVDQTNTSQDVEDLQWAPAPPVQPIAQPTNFALAAREPALVHVSIATDADMGRSFQAAMQAAYQTTTNAPTATPKRMVAGDLREHARSVQQGLTTTTLAHHARHVRQENTAL